jgi:hypothetical protein
VRKMRQEDHDFKASLGYTFKKEKKKKEEMYN